MPVPVFAFDQLPLGKAFEAEGTDVYGFGRAVEDELHKAGTRGGGGLETGAAQPAGEIETVQPRAAIDSALVRCDPIPPDVDGVQAALFKLGDTLNHLVDQLFEERVCRRLVFGVGWLTAQGLVFTSSQDEGATLGAEIAVDDVVDCRRDSPQ